MRASIRNGLLPMNLLAIILIVIILFVPSNTLRIIFGLPFMLFFPGYALTVALFPKRDDIGIAERLALSFGISIAVTSFLGLALNYTPWGINAYSVTILLSIFILAISIVACYRQRRLVEPERFTTFFNLDFIWRGQTTLDRVLSGILIVAILGAVGTLTYAAATPRVGERFTEFYILGQEDKATNYPTELKLDEAGTVTLGIVNREQETTSYEVKLAINGITDQEIRPIVLEHEEKWEEKVSFTPAKAGNEQKVEFFLYKEGELSPIEWVHLWVDVAAQE